MTFEKASINDLPQIIDMRLKLLIEEGAHKQIDIQKELCDYYTKELNKSIFVFLAKDNDKPVATCSLIIQEYPPSFFNKQGLRAYIANMYTLPEYRRQKLAKELMDIAIKEIKARNISYVWLWATRQGLPFYENYGFENLDDFITMDYKIKPE